MCICAEQVQLVISDFSGEIKTVLSRTWSWSSDPQTHARTHTQPLQASKDINQLLLPFTATLYNTFPDGACLIDVCVCVCDMCGWVCVGLIYFLIIWCFVCVSVGLSHIDISSMWV